MMNRLMCCNSEAVENWAAGKSFWFCRICRKEVVHYDYQSLLKAKENAAKAAGGKEDITSKQVGDLTSAFFIGSPMIWQDRFIMCSSPGYSATIKFTVTIKLLEQAIKDKKVR